MKLSTLLDVIHNYDLIIIFEEKKFHKEEAIYCGMKDNLKTHGKILYLEIKNLNVIQIYTFEDEYLRIIVQRKK